MQVMRQKLAFVPRKQKELLAKIALQVRNQARDAFEMQALLRHYLVKSGLYSRENFYYALGILRKSKALTYIKNRAKTKEAIFIPADQL